MLAAQPFKVMPNAPWVITTAGAEIEAMFPHRVSLAQTLNGKPLVAIPHGPREHKALRAAGVRLPNPILHSYQWPSPPGTKPFSSQLQTAAFLVANPRAFVLSDMGVGKTRSAAYALDWMILNRHIRKALIAAPLSTLERVWEQEFFLNFPHLKTVVLHGSAARRKRLLAGKWDVAILNHDGVKVLFEELEGVDYGIDLVLIDELAVFRQAKTDRWRAMRRVCAPRPYVWGMTGSPTPNTPTDAWAQVRLVNPAQAPMKWKAFRDRVEDQVAPHVWQAKEGCQAEVFALMQPAIRFVREQVVELPPITHRYVDIPMLPKQKEYYERLRKEMVLLHANGQVTAANAAVLLSKLAQLAGGVVYNDEAQPLVLVPNPSPRLTALVEAIEETADKVIVFAGYRHTIGLIRDALDKAKITNACIDGSVSYTERNRIFAEFQDEPHPKVLVAHPKTMAHGLTLTAAGTVIWYTPFFSRETYEQANARISRVGQNKKQLILHLVSAPVEKHIYRILETRGKMQAECLRLFAEGGVNL